MCGARRVALAITVVLLLSSLACRREDGGAGNDGGEANSMGTAGSTVRSIASAEPQTPDEALYQANDSVRNALLFIAAPEERLDKYIEIVTRVQRGMRYELAEGRQLDFANRFVALRHTRDGDSIIALLSEGARANLAEQRKSSASSRQADAAVSGEGIIGHLMSDIENGELFEEDSDETRFFAVFSEMSQEMLAYFAERGIAFTERPTHAMLCYHYYKPKTMLTARTHYLIERDGGYRLVDYMWPRKPE